MNIKNVYGLIILILGVVEKSISQNTGIGTTTPAEKLDVNGNINLTGTIKANSVDGIANHVLRKNNSGVLAWGNNGVNGAGLAKNKFTRVAIN